MRAATPILHSAPCSAQVERTSRAVAGQCPSLGEKRPCRAAITRSTPPGSATRRPSGPRPRARSTGTSPGTRCSTPTPASTAAGSRAPSATRPGTASTGTWSAAAAQQKALIYDSPVTKTTRAYTYAELRDEVATLGGVLQDLGVAKGDRVIIYMPMVPEAVIAMLACARIGAIHSVVFGGFAAPELATRIDDAKPVAILSASCGIEPGRVVHYKPLLDAAIELAKHKPQTVLMLQRPMAEASHDRRPRPRLGSARSPTPRRAAARPAASRSRPPTRSTSSTRRAPPASPRAWCATTAGTWWRSSGP